MIHLDASVVVDLQREAAANPGPASALLQARLDEPLCVSVHALCELEAGVRLARHPQREAERLKAVLAGIPVAYPDERFADRHARTYLLLERRGRRVPAMDLLIAVSALIDDAPLATRNASDFRNIPDLVVLSY